MANTTVYMPIPVSYGKKFNVVKTTDDFYILIVPKYRFEFSNPKEAETFISKTVWFGNNPQKAATELCVDAHFDISIPCISPRKEDIEAALFLEMVSVEKKTYDARLCDIRKGIAKTIEEHRTKPIYSPTYGNAELYYVDGIVGTLPSISPLCRANIFEIPFKMRSVGSLDSGEKRDVLAEHIIGVLERGLQDEIPSSNIVNELLNNALQETRKSMKASDVHPLGNGAFVFQQFREYLLACGNGSGDIVDILGNDELAEKTVQMLSMHNDGTDIGKAVSRLTAEMITFDLLRLLVESKKIERGVCHLDSKSYTYTYKESEKLFSSKVFTRSYHVCTETLSRILKAGNYHLVRFLAGGGVDRNGIGAMGFFGEELRTNLSRHPAKAISELFGKQMKSIVASDKTFVNMIELLKKEPHAKAGEQVFAVIEGSFGEKESLFEDEMAIHEKLFIAEGVHGAKSIMERLLRLPKDAFYNTTRTRLPASIAIMRNTHNSLFGKNTHYAKAFLSAFSTRLKYTDSFKMTSGSRQEDFVVADISDAVDEIERLAEKNNLSKEKMGSILTEEMERYGSLKKGYDILVAWRSLPIQYSNQYKKNKKVIEEAAIEVWQMFGEPFFSRYNKSILEETIKEIKKMSPKTELFFDALLNGRDEVMRTCDRNTRTSLFLSQRDVLGAGKNTVSAANSVVSAAVREYKGKAEVSSLALTNAQKRSKTKRR